MSECLAAARREQSLIPTGFNLPGIRKLAACMCVMGADLFSTLWGLIQRHSKRGGAVLCTSPILESGACPGKILNINVVFIRSFKQCTLQHEGVIKCLKLQIRQH